MFRYTTSYPSAGAEAIIQKGETLFVNRAVSSGRDLTLPGWREYTIVEGRRISVVRIPLVHILCPDQDDLQNTHTIREFVSTTEEGFGEGVITPCIYAVLMSIDSEFQTVLKVRDDKAITDSIDKLFSIDVQRERKLQLDKIDTYFALEKISTSANYLLKNIEGVFRDLSILPNNSFKRSLITHIVKYHSEDRTDSLLSHLLLSPRIWLSGQLLTWQIVSEYWSLRKNDNSESQARVLLIMLSFGESLYEVRMSMEHYIKDNPVQSPDVWKTIFEESKDSSWSLYAATLTNNIEWIRELIPKIHDRELISVLEKFPEIREEVDSELEERIKEQSAFIVSTAYNELVDILSMWQNAYPESHGLMNILERIKQEHKTKKSLLGRLKKLGL
jgi:hypothetical protein